MIKVLQIFILSMLSIWCFAKPIYNSNNFTEDVNNEKSCECVSFWLCENGSQIIDGAGLIDMRAIKKPKNLRECNNVMEQCCEPPNIRRPQQLEDSNKPLLDYPSDQRRCGYRNINGVGLRIMNEDENETKFGEFPWMVAVLHTSARVSNLYRCGGSLIHRNVVLTAAHCVYSEDASDFKIRAGEWDTQSSDEILPYQDRSVKEIVIHENYNPRSLRNDFALLILTSPVDTAKSVEIVCLPGSAHEYDSSKCTVSGWGKNEFGKKGQYEPILKDVQLSIIPRLACQSSLRNTRLGKNFELHQSFVCAGGIKGHDSCKGDGGSPLVCPLKSNPQRFVQVGIVSWGIQCGRNLPAVYASLRYARSWIDKQLVSQNLSDVHDVVPNIEDRTSELKCTEYSKKSTSSFWILKQSPIEVHTECPRLTSKMIAGDKATKPHEFPHMVALGKRLNEYFTEYFCAGSVISENWILTAAHCADSAIDFPTVALLGSTVINDDNSQIKDGKLIPVKRIVPHPKYRSPQLYADLALVELSEQVSFTSSLKPACLYSLPQAEPKRLWASGWDLSADGASGLAELTPESNLTKARLRVLTSEQCARIRWDPVRLPRGLDKATQICAGDLEGSDTCVGDSGAPLQARHPLGCLSELFAVTSFGAACGSPPGVLGVYTRIAPYVDWIESVVWPDFRSN